MAKKLLHESPCESLFSEIASRAHRAQLLMREMDAGDSDTAHLQIEMLEAVVFQMGWLADVALTNMNSVMRIYDGDAVRWMTAPATVSALNPGVQHG